MSSENLIVYSENSHAQSVKFCVRGKHSEHIDSINKISYAYLKKNRKNKFDIELKKNYKNVLHLLNITFIIILFIYLFFCLEIIL